MGAIDAVTLLSSPTQRETVHVRPLSSEDEDLWDEFVLQHPDGSLFQQTAWKRAIERTFGYKTCYMLAERANRISAIAPLFFISDWLGGRRLISVPFGVYGGICASDRGSRLRLLDTLKQECATRAVEYLELRNRRHEGDSGFHPNKLYVTFTTTLSQDPDTNLKRLPRDTRYMIRKGEKAGLRAERGPHLKSVFYSLFAQSMHRLGTPVLPRALFDHLHQELGTKMDFMVVYLDFKPITAVVSFFFRDTIFPYYAGAAPEAPKLGANNFMYWELIKQAAQAGYRRFDFGRSKKGTGSYDFKTQWNMDVEPLEYEVFLARRKTVPNFSPINPKFERAIRIWKGMPLWVANSLGPQVVRWLP